MGRGTSNGNRAKGRGLTYVILGARFLAEVIATTALSRSESFTRLGPSLVAVLGYAVAFGLLFFALRVMPTGAAWAMWSGLGVVRIVLVACPRQGQRLDAFGGMKLALAGCWR